MQEAMWSYVEFYPIFYLKVMKVVEMVLMRMLDFLALML